MGGREFGELCEASLARKSLAFFSGMEDSRYMFAAVWRIQASGCGRKTLAQRLTGLGLSAWLGSMERARSSHKYIAKRGKNRAINPASAARILEISWDDLAMRHGCATG